MQFLWPSESFCSASCVCLSLIFWFRCTGVGSFYISSSGQVSAMAGLFVSSSAYWEHTCLTCPWGGLLWACGILRCCFLWTLLGTCRRRHLCRPWCCPSPPRSICRYGVGFSWLFWLSHQSLWWWCRGHMICQGRCIDQSKFVGSK